MRHDARDWSAASSSLLCTKMTARTSWQTWHELRPGCSKKKMTNRKKMDDELARSPQYRPKRRMTSWMTWSCGPSGRLTYRGTLGWVLWALWVVRLFVDVYDGSRFVAGRWEFFRSAVVLCTVLRSTNVRLASGRRSLIDFC